MVNQDLVNRVEIPKSTEISFCEKCVEGKMFRRPFIKSVGAIRSTRKLQPVHSDVCGPMPMDSIGGKRYFVTYCKVYFVKHVQRVQVVYN